MVIQMAARSQLLQESRPIFLLEMDFSYSGAIERWVNAMKKVEAIVRTDKLDIVKTELRRLGVDGMTVAEVRGIGSEQGSEMCYRGVTLRADFVPKAKLETIVADNVAEAIVEAIFQAAHTGAIGDGRILVTQLQSVTRIRTGEVEDGDANASGRQREFQPHGPMSSRPTQAGVENWRGPRTFSGSDETAMDYWASHVES